MAGEGTHRFPGFDEPGDEMTSDETGCPRYDNHRCDDNSIRGFGDSVGIVPYLYESQSPSGQ